VKTRQTIITVARAPGERTRGILRYRAKAHPVALGRGGISTNKREGDGTTPRGSFRPLRIWWRADRMTRPRTSLPLRRIARDDAWCEGPGDRRYNRLFKLSQDAKGDRLWRDDHLYDLFVEIDHNTRPRVANRGSAVFIHLARAGLKPTAGCIAMPLAELKRLVARLDRDSVIRIL
jgi:L,D-peptidoglycan transpeptidase YkuD (ErfK/YbiS/YcfS/YnhG family)